MNNEYQSIDNEQCDKTEKEKYIIHIMISNQHSAIIMHEDKHNFGQGSKNPSDFLLGSLATRIPIRADSSYSPHMQAHILLLCWDAPPSSRVEYEDGQGPPPKRYGIFLVVTLAVCGFAPQQTSHPNTMQILYVCIYIYILYNCIFQVRKICAFSPKQPTKKAEILHI